MLAVELFVYPGTTIPGIAGMLLIVVSVVMGMVDMYPGTPSLPTLPQLRLPLRDLGIATGGAVAAILLLVRFLPKTPIYASLVSQTTSGVRSMAAIETRQASSRSVNRAPISAATLYPTCMSWRTCRS